MTHQPSLFHFSALISAQEHSLLMCVCVRVYKREREMVMLTACFDDVAVQAGHLCSMRPSIATDAPGNKHNISPLLLTQIHTGSEVVTDCAEACQGHGYHSCAEWMWGRGRRNRTEEWLVNVHEERSTRTTRPEPSSLLGSKYGQLHSAFFPTSHLLSSPPSLSIPRLKDLKNLR